MITLLFFINLITTAIMVGLIWIIQLVHYPFFHRVERKTFNLHMDEHRKKISYIVIPVMLPELASAIGLALLESRFQTEFISGFILLLLIWISTAVLQVPSHSKLANGYSEPEVSKLVRLNWVRTTLWSIRLLLLMYVLSQLSFSDL